MIVHLSRGPSPGTRGWCLIKGSENGQHTDKRSEVTCGRCKQTKGYRNPNLYPKEPTVSFTDRNDYEQSLADHHALKEQPMLHKAVAETLGDRRAEIVADLTNTESLIEHIEAELSRTRATHARLLDEMRAIDDAVELLSTIQEATT